MSRIPAIRGLLTGIVLLAGSVAQGFAQAPAPAQMLDPKLGPKFDDVQISVPAPDEIGRCTVELVKGTTAGSSGWLLKDPRGQTLRRFFDSNGDNKVDAWSYYKDGVEVYREFDTAFKGAPNNFRWINTAGMKWGIGGVANGRGYINSWRVISAEEAGAEAFHAIAKQDVTRLQALFISDAEMQMIKLPASKIKVIQANQQLTQKKLADLLKTVNLTSARFEVVESAVPQCDTTSEPEVIKFASRQIRYQLNKDHQWIHTGEMIQVGMAWRLIDVPSDKDPTGAGVVNGGVAGGGNPELDKLLQELADLDAKPPLAKQILDNCPLIEGYYRKRIPLVQKIIPVDKADQREGWYKQLFDNLMAMGQNSGDETTMKLLTQMKDEVVSKMPGSNLAAYGVYRDSWNRYAVAMAKEKNPVETNKIQDKWLENLSDFVKKYSKAEDTPEALHQLAIGCEFGGKTEEAKRWYKQLYENFPNHHLSPRARGSEDRLNLVGNALRLTAPLLSDNAKLFDLATLKGKVVIVHYWGSYSDQYKDDFVRLKRVLDQVGQKQNVELVCINLDETAARAMEVVTKSNAPGIHLFQATNNATGMNSPLATQYGIHILPTLFMVGRDGRVTSNTLQIGDIETELKKVQ